MQTRSHITPRLNQPLKKTEHSTAVKANQKASFGMKPFPRKKENPGDSTKELDIPLKKVHPRDFNKSIPGPFPGKWTSKKTP